MLASDERSVKMYGLHTSVSAMIKFLDLHKQYLGIQAEIDAAIHAVIRDAAFIDTPYNKVFEQEFATYLGASHCLGVANGTDAIEIALEALKLPPGSEVIVPANSFIASSEAVTRSGLKVVFCPCNPQLYTLDIAALRSAITPATKVIIAVHLYGHPCDMGPLMALAKERGLRVIEDCAQAHGAEYRGKKIGALGDLACFSFYPGKNLGAYGDGGAIACNDAALAEQCRMIANHGRKEKYDHLFEGRNSRLDGLQAAILTVKLKHLEAWTQKRIAVADQYNRGLANIPGLMLPQRADWARHVYHLYVVRTSRRNELQTHLRSRGIETGVHYPKALPALGAYRYLGQSTATDALNEEILSLPIGDHLETSEVDAVIAAAKEFFA
jgi:dTDP-4-amino-4,6-dideoxygalactose transaminase